jgi:hypothetical protein
LTIAEKADYYGKQNEKSAYKRLFCTAYLACIIKRRMRACLSFFANVCANGLAEANVKTVYFNKEGKKFIPA